MPGMKGHELLAKAVALFPDIYTILLTGQADISAIGFAVNNAKLYRYITKPWEETDLILTVKEALHSYAQNYKIKDQQRMLTKLVDELKLTNETLEDKVKIRTAEVNTQHDELKQVYHRLEAQNIEIINQRDEYQKINATKDKFFSILAHDLRNPFNTLLSLTDLVKQNLDKLDNRQIKIYIDDIRQTARESYQLLENLLTWSRSQTNRILLAPDALDLHQIVDQTISLVSNEAKRKSISLINNIPQHSYAFADLNTISTVIRNLISNSLKFTNKDGTIQMTCHVENGNIYLSIKDDGVGIAQENLEKLFRLDVSFSTSGTAHEKGTGLGLILCKEFVEKNHGEIQVFSTLGQGTTFMFSLPLSEKAPIPNNENEYHSPLEKESIVEDKDSLVYHLRIFTENLKKTEKEIIIYTRVIEILENDLGQTYEHILLTHRIRDIHEFSQKLQNLGNEYDIVIISEFGKILQQYANTFDIKNINETLKMYDLLLITLKKVLN